MNAHLASSGIRLSTASRHATLQRVFSDNLREWYWQRSTGGKYQVWNPPGIVFAKLRADHHKQGPYIPPWTDWGFADQSEDAPPGGQGCHLVLGALNGRWAVKIARERPSERWVVAESDESRVFHIFTRAMDAFMADSQEPDREFPNIRILFVNERHAPDFFEDGSIQAVHVHLPRAERSTKPRRGAVLTPAFVSEACRVLQVRGELHIVSEDESMVEQACGVLRTSGMYEPRLAFPFHQEGVPPVYPAAQMLVRDAATAVAQSRHDGTVAGGGKTPTLYYSGWQKVPPRLPNARYKG